MRTPTEVITPRHHDLTGLKLSVHSLGKIKTEARLGPMRRDGAARGGEELCAASLSLMGQRTTGAA